MFFIKKDIKISNVKGILIFLVVFGHLIEVYKDDLNGIYLTIYSFHMPLFVLLSGYLAKRTSIKKVMNFVLLYLIFETIYDLFFTLVLRQIRFEYSIPYFHLWYLVSMTFWCLAAIPIKNISKNTVGKFGIVGIALMISLLSRYLVIDGFDEYILSFQRTLSFAFFFFLGFVLEPTTMRKVSTLIKNRLIAAVLLILGIATTLALGNSESVEMIFRGPFNVEQIPSPSLFLITACLLISIYMCLLILNVASSNKSFLTVWGDNSLYIFLFHAFFVIPFYIFPGLLEGINNTLLAVILFLIAIVATVVLSSRHFVKLVAPICNPLRSITKKDVGKNVLKSQ